MKKKKTMLWGAIYVIALITILVIVYVLPSVAGLFDRSYVAKYGNVEVKDDTEGYMVRNETVYTAGKSGTVKRAVTEGELVKGTSKVVKISGEGASSTSNKYDALLKKMKKDDAVISTDSGNTEHPGYITYKLDGLEYLNSDNIFNMSEAEFEKLEKPKLHELADGKVSKGEPILRTSRCTSSNRKHSSQRGRKRNRRSGSCTRCNHRYSKDSRIGRNNTRRLCAISRNKCSNSFRTLATRN